jgi:hypothetical protein
MNPFRSERSAGSKRKLDPHNPSIHLDRRDVAYSGWGLFALDAEKRRKGLEFVDHLGIEALVALTDRILGVFHCDALALELIDAVFPSLRIKRDQQVIHGVSVTVAKF